MNRIPLSEADMVTLWCTFLLTEEEELIEKGEDEEFTPFCEAKERDIETVIKSLEIAGFSVSYQKGKDVHVDEDIYVNRVILTELLANDKRTQIEDRLYQILPTLEVARCICLDVKNHELKKGQRSLISRNGIYHSTEGI